MSLRSWTARIVAGAAAAGALAASSQAATYTFNVHVTQGPTNIFSPTFGPVDFLQTFTLEPTPRSVAFSYSGVSIHSEDATGQATWTPTPFDPRIQAITGIVLPDADVAALKYLNSVAGSAPADAYRIQVSSAATTELNVGVLRSLRESSFSMTASGGPHNNFDPLDAEGLRDLLLYAGPLQWRQEGRWRIFLDGSLNSDTHVVYGGVATLVGFTPTPPPGPGPTPSAAPEPATWALLIAGFGLAGASLRRRRVLRPLA